MDQAVASLVGGLQPALAYPPKIQKKNSTTRPSPATQYLMVCRTAPTLQQPTRK